VLDYLSKSLEKLVDALLEPLWLRAKAWIESLSWQGHILLLVVAGLASLAAVYWNSLPSFYRYAVAFGKVVTSPPTQIPLDSSLAFKVRETSRRLAEGLRADLNRPDKLYPPSAWTLAQEAAANSGMIKINAELVRTYFRNMEVACNCWQETPDGAHPPNVAVSGWVLFALAELNFPATEAEVRFFLSEQKRDGWWPTFQSTDSETFASTWSTAWALIGLQTQLRNGLIPQTMEEEVSNAVGNGSTWLERQGSNSRWKDYPSNRAGNSSDSLSGLVMHALHLTASDSITQLKRDWLDNLPTKVPPAVDRSQNLIWVTLRDGTATEDKVVQVTLPWMLIATVDAYSAGNYFERTRALLWIEGALDQEAVIHAETQVENWWRAEFLLALRYVVG
jgi:hypothetical protein